MDLSLKYSKTSKGAKAVLTKSRTLSSPCMQVLSNIDGKTPATAIQAKLQYNDEKFSQALAQLLDEAYIQVVQDFGPSVFDLKAAIEVSEISTEEFLQLGLPEDNESKTEQQIEADARAKVYAEEQARKEAQTREQEAAERKLLMVTDILAKSGHKIDIEKLAEPGPSPVQHKIRAETPLPSKSPHHSAVQPSPESQSSANRLSNPARTTTPISTSPAAASATPHLDSDTRPASNKEAPAKEIEREEAVQHSAAAAQAKLQAETLAKAETERLAQEAAKRRAQEIAEAEARAQEEAARIAEKARRAEEKARKEEEKRLRKEAEASRKRAEQQARDEAKAQAKADAERRAREDAARRAQEKAEAEARARENADRKSREKAELNARRAAEAELKAESDRRLREEARVRNEAIARDKAAAKEEAKRQAEQRAIVRSEAWQQNRSAISASSILVVNKLLGILRPLAISLALVMVALLVLLQFTSLKMWAQPVERSIATNIGEPVTIRDVHVSFWPRPHLLLENVSVGSLNDISARKVQIYPALMSLWSQIKTLDKIEAEGLNITQDSLTRPMRWVDTTHKQQQYLLSSIILKSATIKMPEHELPSFDAEVVLNKTGALKAVKLHSKNVAAEITPANDALSVRIKAQGWQMPIGAGLVFDELNAIGTANHEKLVLPEIEGLLYGGNMKGNLNISWNRGWHADGNFELANINLAEATPHVSQHAHLKGRAYATGAISATATRAELLPVSPSIVARFEAEQGEIGGLDLARAASGREQVSGVTRYDQLAGSWVLKNRQYRLSQLSLKAGSLSAQGDIEISPAQEISGKVQTRLGLSSRQMQGRFNVSGKLGSVRISR